MQKNRNTFNSYMRNAKEKIAGIITNPIKSKKITKSRKEQQRIRKKLIF